MKLRRGMVFVSRNDRTRTPCRRILATTRLPGTTSEQLRICYSDGKTTRWCSLTAFRIWLRTRDAVQTRTRRPRSMQLRAPASRCPAGKRRPSIPVTPEHSP